MRPISIVCNRHIILPLTLAAVGFEFLRNSIGTFFVVEGASMYPTFRPDDVVQARTMYSEPARGDVVVVTDDRGDHAIKRIIGLPGETVTLYGGFIYIDRQRMIEPYLPEHTYTFKSDESNELPAEWKLGANEYFVLGDNRFESRDSRDFGALDRHHIHRLVSVPGNEPKPGFCDILLQGSGTAAAVTFSPRLDRIRRDQQVLNTKT